MGTEMQQGFLFCFVLFLYFEEVSQEVMLEARLMSKKECGLSWTEEITPGQGRTRIGYLKVQICISDHDFGVPCD